MPLLIKAYSCVALVETAVCLLIGEFYCFKEREQGVKSQFLLKTKNLLDNSAHSKKLRVLLIVL
jgi:hypothetical protein